PVDPQAQAAQRPDHEVGIAAAQRATDGRRALAQRREHQRAVGLRFRAGNGHRCVHRGWRDGCRPCAHRSIISCPGRVMLLCHHGVMCGRFAVTPDPALLAEKIKAIDEATDASKGASNAPNYNVAPTTTVATVVTRHSEPEDDPTRRVRLMRWGLIPPWV